MSEEVQPEVTAEVEEIDSELGDSTRAHLKDERKAYYAKMIEEDLQILIKEAATIRNKITDAKTVAKKDFYKKKFAKVNAQVRQYVGALHRLGAISSPEGTDNEPTITTDPITG